MRIAIFHDLPSGGAKRTLYEAARRLCQHHTLDVFSLSTADAAFCSLSPFANSETVYPFSPGRLLKSPFGRINQFVRWLDLLRLDRLSRRIAKEIDAGNYDVVYVQPCMWTQAPPVLLYLKTPTVYYCHEAPRHLYETSVLQRNPTGVRRLLDAVDPLIRLYRGAARRIDRRAVRASGRVLVNSAFTEGQVERIYGINPAILYQGVDTDVFMPGGRQGKETFILSVGAIQPHKGFDFVIESLSCLERSVRPGLHLIGNMSSPAYLQALQESANEKGVDLHLELNVDMETLVQQYRDALFIVYAPYNEPFGLVPLEAMACGRPVVGVREGGVIETVVHERTGLLTDRDPHQFAAAIRSLLENEARREAYGRDARAYVEDKWSWDQSIRKLEAFFVEATGH